MARSVSPRPGCGQIRVAEARVWPDPCRRGPGVARSVSPTPGRGADPCRRRPGVARSVSPTPGVAGSVSPTPGRGQIGSPTPGVARSVSPSVARIRSHSTNSSHARRLTSGHTRRVLGCPLRMCPGDVTPASRLRSAAPSRLRRSDHVAGVASRWTPGAPVAGRPAGGRRRGLAAAVRLAAAAISTCGARDQDERELRSSLTSRRGGVRHERASQTVLPTAYLDRQLGGGRPRPCSGQGRRGIGRPDRPGGAAGDRGERPARASRSG